MCSTFKENQPHPCVTFLSVTTHSFQGIYQRKKPRYSLLWCCQSFFSCLPVPPCIAAATCLKEQKFPPESLSFQGSKLPQTLPWRQSKRLSHLLEGFKTHVYQTTTWVFQPHVQIPHVRFHTHRLRSKKGLQFGLLRNNEGIIQSLYDLVVLDEYTSVLLKVWFKDQLGLYLGVSLTSHGNNSKMQSYIPFLFKRDWTTTNADFLKTSAFLNLYGKIKLMLRSYSLKSSELENAWTLPELCSLCIIIKNSGVFTNVLHSQQKYPLLTDLKGHNSTEFIYCSVLRVKKQVLVV